MAKFKKEDDIHEVAAELENEQPHELEDEQPHELEDKPKYDPKHVNVDDQVSVNVPKRYQVTIKNKILVFYPGGQVMDRSVAEHWYSKANGVTIVKG